MQITHTCNKHQPGTVYRPTTALLCNKLSSPPMRPNNAARAANGYKLVENLRRETAFSCIYGGCNMMYVLSCNICVRGVVQTSNVQSIHSHTGQKNASSGSDNDLLHELTSKKVVKRQTPGGQSAEQFSASTIVRMARQHHHILFLYITQYTQET